MQSQLHPTLKWEGRVIGLRIFVIDCLENKIFKQGCLEAEVLKKCFMTIFVIECMKQCFLFKYDQILREKTLKMKVKVTDISSAKSNQV